MPIEIDTQAGLEVFEDVNVAQLAERLHQARLRQRLSQNTVAVCAGLHPTHYNSIERGHTPGVRINTLFKLCMVLRVSADWLLGLPEALPPARSDHDGAV